MSAILIISIVLLALGAFFMLVGAAGVIRFPDFYTRLHAAGIGDTLGQSLVLLGLALPVFADGFGQVAFKLLLIMLFVFVFNPTATHALARGAWIIGLEPWKKPAGEEEPEDAEQPLDATEPQAEGREGQD